MRSLLLAMGLSCLATQAQAQVLDPGRAAFRAIYKELVEIDTSAATGSCTRAAEAMAAHLRAAGYPESDFRVIVPEGRPDDGNLVAILPGKLRERAILLLAHIDVVNANRADWERDPFQLIEENGYFYGRGASDNKSMAAVFVDLMLRLRRQGIRPRRSIRMALTCGEETSNRVNGVEYLLAHNRDWLQSEYAINEGGGGMLAPDGRPLALYVQAGEKVHQPFKLTVTNPGGHSSLPVPENAIYRLSAGLQRIAQYHFPVELSAVTRTYFERMASIVGGETGAAMTALAADPGNAKAAAVLARDPSYNASMRTTCVATQVEAGHAANALPQRAVATLSCRLLPGHTAREVQAELQRALGDPHIKLAPVGARPPSEAPPLTRQVLAPVERVVQRMWPGLPIVPTMLPAATDGRLLNNAAIPTYGLSGMFEVPDETFRHGLNEKIRVRSLYDGRDFLEAIVRDYANSNG